MDVNQPSRGSSVGPVDDSCPYLILDIRDRDEYDACHLISGNCFDVFLLPSSSAVITSIHRHPTPPQSRT